MKYPRRALENINAGSMADIAFLLLVFFLVTTTMNPEIGIPRKLPPPEDSSGEVKRRNVLNIMVNEKNQLLVANRYIEMRELTQLTKEFIVNPQNKDELPEKEIRYIEGLGEVAVSKQIISLKNDAKTNYGTYLAIQDALSLAYHEVRNECSKNLFNTSFDALIESKDIERIKIVKSLYP